MSSRRRFRVVKGPRPTVIAEAVVTAAMVQEWKADPETIPAEWRDFWESHAVAAAPSDAVPGGSGVREATFLDALAMVAEERDQVERSVSATVGMARVAGHTWEQIGDALGVSKQAARQRYGP